MTDAARHTAVRTRVSGHDGTIHRAVDEQRRVVAAAAKAALCAPFGLPKSIDDHPIDRIVERAERVRARSPLCVGIRMATRAALGLGQSLARQTSIDLGLR